MSDKPIRAVAYCRVSTGRQAVEGVSLDTQVDMARQYCEERGWEFVGHYTDVKTGKSSRRPEMKRLAADAKAKRFDMVVFYKIDRLSRRARQWYELWGVFEDANVGFVSLTQPIDASTAQGRFLFGQYILIAELESANTSDRVSHNMRTLAARGNWVGAGSPPVGYIYQAKGDDGTPGKLTPDPKRVDEVRLIFEKLVELRSVRALCDWLAANGHRTKGGKPYRAEMILYIIRNPAYVGRVVYGRFKEVGPTRRKVQQDPSKWVTFENAHEAIIDQALWDEANAILDGNKKWAPRHADPVSRHAWAGLLLCDGCGRSLHRQPKYANQGGERRPYYYYICPTYSRSGRSACPAYGRVSDVFLDEVLAPLVAEVVDRAAELQPASAPKPVKRSRKTEDPTKVLAEMEARKERAKRAFLAGLLDLEEAQAIKLEVDAVIAALCAPRELDAPMPMPAYPGKMVAALPLMAPHERNEILDAFIRSCKVGPKSIVLTLHAFDHPTWPTEPITIPIPHMRTFKAGKGPDLKVLFS